MSLQEVLTRYGFEFDGQKVEAIVKGTKRAEQNLSATAAGVTRINSGLSTAMGYAKGAVLGWLGMKGISFLTTQYADQADAAAKAAQSTGMTVEEYTRLAYAADLANVKSEALNMAMGRLAKRAKEKGDLRSPIAILEEYADTVAAMPDGTAKTALAIERFGKSGAALIPMLNDGSKGMRKLFLESDRLGNTILTKDAKAAEKYKDDLRRLQRGVEGIRNEIGAKLIPILNRVVLAVSRGIVAFRKWWHESNATRYALDAMRVAAAAAALHIGLLVAAQVAKWAQAAWQGIAILAHWIRVLGTRALWAYAKLLWPVLAIAALVLAIEDLIAFAQGKDSIIGRLLGGSDVGKVIKMVLSEVGGALRELVATIGPVLKDLWGVLGPALKSLWGLLKPVLIFLAKVLGLALFGIVLGIIGLIKLLTLLVKYTIIAAKAIGRAFVAAWEWIKEVWGSVVGFFKDVWSGIKDAWSGVVQFFADIAQAIKNFWWDVGEFFAWLWGEIKGAASFVGDAIKRAFTWAAEAAQKAWRAVIDTIKDAYNWAEKAAKKSGAWIKKTFTVEGEMERQGLIKNVGDILPTLPSEGMMPASTMPANSRTTFNSAVVGAGAVNVVINGVPDAAASAAAISDRINRELSRVITNASRDLAKPSTGQQ